MVVSIAAFIPPMCVTVVSETRFHLFLQCFFSTAFFLLPQLFSLFMQKTAYFFKKLLTYLPVCAASLIAGN